MCDRNKQQCDEKRDHKDHQDLGDLHKMLNKDDNKQGDFSGMKGDAHGGMQQQDPSCGGQKCGDKKGAECDKKKECH